MVTLNLDDIDSLTPSLHPSVFAQGPHGPLGANIFVFHIPDDWNDETFFKYFAPFGEVESGGIQTDKRTGRFRGFGFVSYRHPLHAAKAIKWMDGMRVMKKRLAVQPKTGEGVFLNAALDAERKAQNKPLPIPKHQIETSCTIRSNSSIINNSNLLFPNNNTCTSNSIITPRDMNKITHNYPSNTDEHTPLCAFECPPPYDEAVDVEYLPCSISPSFSPNLSPRDICEPLCSFFGYLDSQQNNTQNNNQNNTQQNNMRHPHFSPSMISVNSSLPSSSPVLLPSNPLSLIPNSQKYYMNENANTSPLMKPLINNNTCNSCQCCNADNNNNSHSHNNTFAQMQSTVSSPIGPSNQLHTPSPNNNMLNLKNTANNIRNTSTNDTIHSPLLDSLSTITPSSNIWTPVTYETSPIYNNWMENNKSPSIQYETSPMYNTWIENNQNSINNYANKNCASPAFGVVQNFHKFNFRHCINENEKYEESKNDKINSNGVFDMLNYNNVYEKDNKTSEEQKEEVKEYIYKQK